MKASRIATFALLATAAVGFNAFAGDRYEPEASQSFVSTLSRAEVHAQAVKSVRDNQQRGFNAESGEYLISAPAAQATSGLTREAVRAEALKSRNSFELLRG